MDDPHQGALTFLIVATLVLVLGSCCNWYRSRETSEDSRSLAPGAGRSKTVELGAVHQPADKRPLPPGWVEMVDPDSGDPYYVNEAQGVNSWRHPDDTV
jgi:hypothetical protein